MDITLFLGAGFSKPFGLPVMREFFQATDSNDRLTHEDREFLGRILLEARQSNSFLRSSPTNLEDILSFAVMGDRVGLGGPNKADSIRRVLQKVYGKPSDLTEYWERYDKLWKFLGLEPRYSRSTKLSIVTTNYDLNAECALARLGKTADPGFPFEEIQGGNVNVKSRLYSHTGVPVLKLHGSINWFASEKNDNLLVENRVVGIRGDGGPSTRALPYPCTRDWESPASPIIVPPSFLKPELPKALGLVWGKAAQALSESQIVIFVGYSFPDSDTEMMYFLATALKDNPRLRRIVLVDPYVDSVVSRLRGPTSRVGNHFLDLLEPIQESWLDVELDLGSTS